MLFFSLQQSEVLFFFSNLLFLSFLFKGIVVANLVKKVYIIIYYHCIFSVFVAFLYIRKVLSPACFSRSVLPSLGVAKLTILSWCFAVACRVNLRIIY